MALFTYDRSDFQVSQDIPDYQNLPDLAVLEIFEYLSARDLRRVGSSCKKFYMLSKEVRTWTYLDMNDFHLNKSNLVPFLSRVPEYFTRLNIFIRSEDEGDDYNINILNLCLVIYMKFPHLEELHLEVFKLSYSPEICPGVIHLMLKSHRTDIDVQKIMNDLENNFNDDSYPIFLPQSLRLLAYRSRSEKEDFPKLISLLELPNLYVLEISNYMSNFVTHEEIKLLSSLTQLRELYLTDCFDKRGIKSNKQYFNSLNVLKFCMHSSYNLGVLAGHAENLTELHVCLCYGIGDIDFDFVDSNTFPNLQIFCAYDTLVTGKGAERLSGLCHSLKTFNGQDGDPLLSNNIKYGVYRRILGKICFFPHEEGENVWLLITYHQMKYSFHSDRRKIAYS